MTDHDLQQLLAETGPALHRLLYRITLREDAAEDLLQELFIRLSTSQAFRASNEPHHYATRAAVNLAIDWRRAQCRDRAIDDAAMAPAHNEPAEREDLDLLLDALSLLRGSMRDAVVLRYLHGADYRAVGAALDRSPHQARALCRKGIVRLTSILQSQGNVPCEP